MQNGKMENDFTILHLSSRDAKHIRFLITGSNCDAAAIGMRSEEIKYNPRMVVLS